MGQINRQKQVALAHRSQISTLEVRQPWLAKFEVAARELSSLLVNGLITDRQTHAFALGQQEERRLADAMTKEEYDKWEGQRQNKKPKLLLN